VKEQAQPCAEARVCRAGRGWRSKRLRHWAFSIWSWCSSLSHFSAPTQPGNWCIEELSSVAGVDESRCHHPAQGAEPLALCLHPMGERLVVRHGQGLILQWFKHLGPSAEPPSWPPPPAPSCVPKHAP